MTADEFKADAHAFGGQRALGRASGNDGAADIINRLNCTASSNGAGDVCVVRRMRSCSPRSPSDLWNPLITVPSIQYGGYFLLRSLMDRGSRYMDNPLRQNFFRAGHAHAGVFVLLSLVCLMLADAAALPSWRDVVGEAWGSRRRDSCALGILLVDAVAKRDRANRAVSLIYLGAALTGDLGSDVRGWTLADALRSGIERSHGLRRAFMKVFQRFQGVRPRWRQLFPAG